MFFILFLAYHVDSWCNQETIVQKPKIEKKCRHL